MESTIPTLALNWLPTHKGLPGNDEVGNTALRFVILSNCYRPHCLLLTLLTLYQSWIKLPFLQTEHFLLLLLPLEGSPGEMTTVRAASTSKNTVKLAHTLICSTVCVFTASNSKSM